jgi:hypothetical protein
MVVIGVDRLITVSGERFDYLFALLDCFFQSIENNWLLSRMNYIYNLWNDQLTKLHL